MTYLVVILLLINVVLIVLFLRPLLNSGARPSEQKQGQLVHDTATAQTEKELQEMADRVLDRMDRKIDVLKKLIDQADERIVAVSGIQKSLPKPSDLRRELDNDPLVYKSLSKSEKHAAIARLFREGMSKEEIARTTHTGMGEVDLIVNMEKRARKRTGA